MLLYYVHKKLIRKQTDESYKLYRPVGEMVKPSSFHGEDYEFKSRRGDHLVI